MSDKVIMSYDDYRHKFRKCIESINEILSKEFEVDVEISSGAKYVLWDEIAENYIEIETNKEK